MCGRTVDAEDEWYRRRWEEEWNRNNPGLENFNPYKRKDGDYCPWIRKEIK